jgi:DNA invertase Pin-like site-specific DNA recombinase
VSTEEQAEEGGSLVAQRKALDRLAAERSWSTLWVEDAGVSGASMSRPGMQQALEMLVSGRASILAATTLSRLSRSMEDGAALMRLANESGFALVVLDLSVDMTTASGRFATHVMQAAAEWERGIRSEATRAGMAAIKARTGKHMGRPVELSPAIRAKVTGMRDSGMTFRGIAHSLEEQGVPAVRGGRWHPSSVRGAVYGWRSDHDETTPIPALA